VQPSNKIVKPPDQLKKAAPMPGRHCRGTTWFWSLFLCEPWNSELSIYRLWSLL